MLIIQTLISQIPPRFSQISIPYLLISSMDFQFHHRKLLHDLYNHYHDTPLKKLTPQQSQPQFSLPKLPPPPPPLPYKSSPQNHPHFQTLQIALIFMACMVSMVMLLCTVSIAIRNYYSRRRHNRSSRRRNAPILFDVNGDSHSHSPDDVVHPIWYIRTVGLQQSFIDSITVFKYRKDEGLIDGTECSVCLGEFQHDESLRLLPKCSHAFHVPCIDTWLRSHKNCPLCRAPVVATNDGSSSSDDSVTATVTDDQQNDSGENQNLEVQVQNADDSVAGNDDGISSSEIQIPGKILPVRRSISMDSSSSVSVIFRDVVESERCDEVNSSNRKDHVGVSIGKNDSGKFKRLLQKKPVSMRRSFSHSRKILFSKHGRSQSSILPL